MKWSTVFVTLALFLSVVVGVLAFARGARSSPAAGPQVDQADLDNFITRYYRSPSPEKAPSMLQYIISDMPSNAEAPMAYFFARIAEQNPEVMRGYEAVFEKASHSQRQFVLQIFGLAGDAKNREFLVACTQEERYRSEAEEIKELLKHDPKERFVALKRLLLHPTEASQLDQLWCEFIVTGDTEPVSVIIDVLGLPDRLRVKLDSWLNSASSKGTTEDPRVRVCQHLEEAAGIVCDLPEGKVRNQDDLDLRSVLDGLQMSSDRFGSVIRALPFPLTDQDKLYMAFKSSAAWSLASNARQHQRVFQVCKVEAEKRDGRTRLTLLAIVARGCDDKGE